MQSVWLKTGDSITICSPIHVEGLCQMQNSRAPEEIHRLAKITNIFKATLLWKMMCSYLDVCISLSLYLHICIYV